ncbi:SurA N-terminal domain-containing protein [Tahibacter amnicola]|uniref:Periplasmic chaperone PpiD n=1 Tax=Tahibacter amnicola TaxID=2976241 RepID=A0ABY6BIM8_9GAMM|nr:SurA N-terminal domain-containing protein [Tahibacter amnicola]UXI69617.1 SurA N-terminal domain-containing protein [Tahibacter amnicola]
MLQALREKSSGLIAKIVLGLLIFVFSFFGIESYFQSTQESWVAKVGKTEITPEQYRDALDTERNRITSMMGGQVDGAMFERPEHKRRVLEGLITRQLVLQANEDLGIVVADQRIREQIQDVPAFQEDGKFSAQRYTTWLASQGKTTRWLEERIREDLATSDLPGQIMASAVITPREIDNHIRLRDQTRDLRHVVLPKPAADSVKIEDAAVEDYYKSHGSEFMTEEQVALDYVEIDAAKLNVDATPDDAQLKDRYEKEKARFLSPEQRLVSHILVVSKGGDAEAQKKALAKAQDLLKQVRDGKAFADVAKASTEDLGSKAQGGDLGWLEKGVAEPAFDAVAFEMKKGDISEPVLTGEGYHIIQLRDIREKKEKPFEEVKAELAKEFIETERDRVFNDIAGKATDVAYSDAGTLETTAKVANTTVQKVPLFSRRGGTGIAANPAVIKAAFSNQLLVEGVNSDGIDLSPTHKVFIRVADHKRPEQKPLDVVREEIRAKLTREALAKQAKDAADAVLARVKKGDTLDAVAAESKLKVETNKGVGRQAANLDSALVAAAFKLPRPAEGKSEAGTVALPDNAYAVIVVDAVTDGDVAKVDDAGRESVRTQLQNEVAAVEARAFIETLRKATTIEISEERLTTQ